MKITPGDKVKVRVDSSLLPTGSVSRTVKLIDCTVIATYHPNTPTSEISEIAVIIPDKDDFRDAEKLDSTSWAPSDAITLHPYLSTYNGRYFIWVSTSAVVEEIISRPRGQVDSCQCSKCKDWIFMAGPNQADGSFICRSCRENPFR